MNPIDKLAKFILDEVEGEPSQDQGAIDTAIRIIKQQKSDLENLRPIRIIDKTSDYETLISTGPSPIR